MVETGGFLQLLSNPTVVLIPYVLACFNVFLLARKRGVELGLPRYGFIIFTVFLGCSWSFASGMYWDGSITASLSSAVELGIPAILFVLVYFDDAGARMTAFGVVFFQLFVGAVMSLVPSSPLNLLTVHVQQAEQTGNTATALYGASEAPLRASAQFGHPVNFAVWAAAGFVIGLYVVLNNRGLWRLVGLALTLEAAACLVSSESRGGISGIALGVFIMLLRSKNLLQGRWVALAAFVAVSLLTFWDDLVSFVIRNRQLSAVFDRFANSGYDSDLTYRFSALERFQDFLQSDYIVVGLGNSLNVVSKFDRMPHQSFLAATELHGVPVGVATGILAFAAATGVFVGESKYDKQNGTKGFAPLPIVMSAVVIDFMFTNHNAGASLLYMCAGLAALPWVFRQVEAPDQAFSWPALQG